MADIPTLTGYEILERIGCGGNGEVYLARQLSLNRRVAIKFLRPVSAAEKSGQFARFERESLLLADLTCPNIITVFDRGVTNGQPYLVTEYVEGCTLRDYLQSARPMGLERVRSVLRSVTQAVNYLHDRDILHRDLKPENVFVDQQGNVKVGDLGIATMCADLGAVTQSGQFLGSIDYMAPEQRHRLPVDLRADEFALAAIAYEMLTGHKPLGSFEPPSTLNSQLSEEVDAVILRGLQREPDDRFRTVAEFSKQLDKSLERCVTTKGEPITNDSCSDVSAAIDKGNGNQTRWWPGVLGITSVVLLGCVVVIGASRNLEQHVPDKSTRNPRSVNEQPRTIEQTGALPYRLGDGEVQVLLVRTRRNSHWTIPRATNQSGIMAIEAAAEEAYEEAGVRGVASPTSIGSYTYKRNEKHYRVSVYPVRVELELEAWPEVFRARTWSTSQAAADLVASDGLRDLLLAFESESAVNANR
ncbi:MAG: protein kinase [Planctomycetes bacterium]|nr:protein kinase [Planctomycetota bacterium]